MLSLDPSCHILFLSCMSWDEDIPVSPVPAARKFCPSTWAKINCELTSVSMWLRIHLSPIGGFCQEFCHSDGESMRLQTPIYRNSTLLWRTVIKDINKEDDVYTFFFHSSTFYDPYLELVDWRTVNCSELWVQIIHLKCSITKSWLSWVVIITKL